MPEIRKDPIVNRVAIIATSRAERPSDFAEPVATSTEATLPSYSSDCPFCPGNESQTPVPLDERFDERGNWTVRVVPNRYPAVSMEVDSNELNSEKMTGTHEVLIESPCHSSSFAQLSLEQIECVVTVWRDRIAYWRADGRFRCAMLFKNAGLAAGASLQHVHSQLIVLPRIPAALQEELDAAQSYAEEFAIPGQCLFCDLLKNEIADGSRLVFSDKQFTAITANAPRQAFETWLFPSKHAEAFDLQSDDQIACFAQAIKRAVVAIEKSSPVRDYNVILHTAPFDITAPCGYHWHVEIVPRSASFAGYEIGSGETIVSVAPERAAVKLRNALV